MTSFFLKWLEGKHVSAEPVEQTIEKEDEQTEQADHEATSIIRKAEVPTPTSTTSNSE